MDAAGRAVPETKNVRGLKVYTRTSKAIEKLQERHPAEIHGDKIWFSSYLIMDYLDVVPLRKGGRMMEVGCGWGLLAIHCARKFNARVTAVDADPNVFPYLRLHADTNRARVRTRCMRYQSIPYKRLKGLDLLAGGDICFWDELVNPLFSLIRRAVRAQVEIIVIADPGRGPFLKLAKRCRLTFRGTQLLPWSIDKPLKKDGYLLIIYP
jgi:predicted nicotinamide N-methyase